ncbi:MAG: hypothetical protein L7F77_02600 [Candidatus Magnetominusculus sp. LBB02]|nr:hypothetical protein [Candidatus Magnetominusculus sp. LBB02]
MWLPIKDYYAALLVYVSAPAAAMTKGASFDMMERLDGAIRVKLTLKKYMAPCTITIATSRYTFNFPLSLAITAVLLTRIDNKRKAIAAVLAVLLCVHLLYLYSLETLALTRTLYEKNLRDVGFIEMNVHMLLYNFTDELLLRLEPFIMGFVLYFKFMGKNEGG